MDSNNDIAVVVTVVVGWIGVYILHCMEGTKMVKKESGTKSLAWCIIAFSLGCLICAFMGCNEAQASIDYKQQIEYKWPTKKSWRQIIKEVIEKKRKECEPPVDMDDTIPIPIYDGISWDEWWDLA